MTSQAPDRSVPPSSGTTRTSTDLVASSGPDVSAILDAAGLVNLSPSLSAAAARALASHTAAQKSPGGGRVLLDDKRAAAETEWMQKVLDASFPKAPGRMFPSATSSDSDQDSQDRENAAVRLIPTQPSPPYSASTSPAHGRVNGGAGVEMEEDEDEVLEEALNGVWKMYRAHVGRDLVSSRSRAGERFVAIAHRVVSRQV